MKLPVVSAKELERALLRHGYVFSHQTGSHRNYVHTTLPKIVVPIHGNADLKPGLLHAILKKAEIPRSALK